MGGDKWVFPQIDTRNIICLNESVDGAGQLIVKPFDTKSTCTPFVESCDDAELVIKIPFTEGVRLHTLCIGTGATDMTVPSKVHLFVDRDDITCGDHGIKPTQSFELTRDPLCEIEYPLNASKFSNPSSVTLHVVGHEDDVEKIRVSCIGFKGELTHVKRGVVITVYEQIPSGKDVKRVPGSSNNGSSQVT
jgi:hypothetical protein